MKDTKKYIVIGAFLLVGLVYISRLFYIQVGTDKYRMKAESVLSRVEIQPAYRGIIYDRKGKILAYNKPVFELLGVKRNMSEKFKPQVCEVLKITQAEYDEKIKTFKTSYLPYTFIKEITPEQYSKIRDKFDFPGFEFRPKIIRAYPHKSLANTLGYVAEISDRQLSRDTTGYYKSRDFIGWSGIEKTYERYLQGKRGVTYTKVDAKGVANGTFNEGKWDQVAQKGQNLTTTLDLELQQYGESLLKNKIGGIVAINPKTGGILSMVTGPSYDPNLLSGEGYSRNYGTLVRDTLKPLYHRAVQASYPPGSIFKLLQTIVALGDSSTTLNEKIYCRYGRMGDHAPQGYYDYHRGIMLSSNTYYVQLFNRMLDKDIMPNMYDDTRESYKLWYKTITSFGLGSKLGSDIANENAGQIPSAAFYDKVYKGRWYSSYITSNAIGQGELLITPLQMANMTAILANQGFFYTPHIVSAVDGSTEPVKEFYKRRDSDILNPRYYTAVANAMEDVVLRGTARRAITKGISVCGKTGTIENPHGEDHSCFVAFAPKENPQIAIAVYVENAGYGGTWAAPIASLMIEKYLKGTISDPYKEARILEKDFINPEAK